MNPEKPSLEELEGNLITSELSVETGIANETPVSEEILPGRFLCL